MSLVSLSMASPFKEPLYMYAGEDENKFVEKKNNIKYRILKCIELVFAILGMILFVVGVSAKNTTIADMIISVFFGVFILYPIIYLAFKFVFKKSRNDILAANLISTIGVIAIGGCIISEWWESQNINDKYFNKQMEKLVIEEKTAVTLKLISSLSCFLNGVVYLSETATMGLEIAGYV